MGRKRKQTMVTGLAALLMGASIYNTVLAAEPGTDNELAKDVLYFANIARQQNGLSLLQESEDLRLVAQLRAGETVVSYSHTRPDGRPWYTAFDDMNVVRSCSGENLVMGQANAATLVSSWMNSETHRKILLSDRFQKTGVGFVYKDGDDISYVAQVFTD